MQVSTTELILFLDAVHPSNHPYFMRHSCILFHLLISYNQSKRAWFESRGHLDSISLNTFPSSFAPSTHSLSPSPYSSITYNLSNNISLTYYIDGLGGLNFSSLFARYLPYRYPGIAHGHISYIH